MVEVTYDPAIVLLGTILGLKFMLIYIGIGLAAGILGGLFFDLIKGERYLLLPDILNKEEMKIRPGISEKLTLKDRHRFAVMELRVILSRIWKWVLIGVGLGAALHGFVPEKWITDHLGEGQWWSVPAAVLLGIPLYSNATGIIPVAETLLAKGLPVGTTMALMMSTVAASFPEFILLKQVMKGKLLLALFALLLFFFTIAGWILNAVF